MFSLRWFSCRRVHQCEAWHHTGRTRKWWWISHLGVGHQHLKGYGKFMWCDIVTSSLWVTELLQLKSVLKKKKKKRLSVSVWTHLWTLLPSGSSRRVTPKSFSATLKACSRFSRLVCWYTLPMLMSLGLRNTKMQLITHKATRPASPMFRITPNNIWFYILTCNNIRLLKSTGFEKSPVGK